MKLIKQRSELKGIADSALRNRIHIEITQLENCYEEEYEATRHGWFAVFEEATDFDSPIGTLTFSLKKKLDSGEIEHVRFCPDYFEVLITLNDTEAVLVFIPERLAQQTGLNVALYQQAYLY